MATVVRTTQRIPQRSINRFSALDNEPARVLNLATANLKSLVTVLGISARLAKQIVRIRKKHPLRTHADLYAIPGANRAAVERIRRRSLLEGDTCAIITDVLPTNRRIMSYRPFILRVSFVAGPAAPPVLARVAVEWAGKPFHLEQRTTRANLLAGYVDVKFDRKHTLPSGPAVFRATLFNSTGRSVGISRDVHGLAIESVQPLALTTRELRHWHLQRTRRAQRQRVRHEHQRHAE